MIHLAGLPGGGPATIAEIAEEASAPRKFLEAILSFGVPPATASASVHAAEVFTTAASAYLSIMGLVIIWRATKKTRERAFPIKFSAPLGLVGGFFDAIGGGWGPTVTTMVGTGQDPRVSIGATNTAEFFVASAIPATFLAALLTGHWDQAEGFASRATAILGLILGGRGRPLAGVIARVAPRQALTYGVSSWSWSRPAIRPCGCSVCFNAYSAA